MKKTITTAIAALALGFAATANAAVLDFANEADTNGERGVANGDLLTIDGVDIRLFALDDMFNDRADANPYLDAGNAGLGVCSTGLTRRAQCVVSSDDNVTMGEGVGILFDAGLFDANSFVLRGANHALLGDDTMVSITTAGIDLMFETRTDSIGAFLALAAAGDDFFADLTRIGFGFAGTQFYLSALDVDPSAVPVPAAGLLFLTGAAGAAIARRRGTKVAA